VGVDRGSIGVFLLLACVGALTSDNDSGVDVVLK
jgi:hypothetical protein